MTLALRLLLCVFLAINIAPNETTKPILRGGNDNDEDFYELPEKILESLAAEARHEKENSGEEDGRRYIQRRKDIKPILRGGFENGNNLQMLRAVDQVVENVNEDEYINQYGDKYIKIYTQRDDSYEEVNDDKIEDTDGIRIEDGQRVEAESELINKLLTTLLLNNYLSQRSDLDKNFDDSSSSSVSVRSELVDKPILGHVNNDTLLQYGALRSCYSFTKEHCRRACRKTYKSVCRKENCNSRLKNKFVKRCKYYCKEYAE